MRDDKSSKDNAQPASSQIEALSHIGPRMIEMEFNHLLGLGVATVILVLLLRRLNPSSRTGLPLPPGPQGYPVIGNTLQIPPEHAWRQYVKWFQQYGPLVHLNVAGKTFLLIGNAQVAKDLLDKRAPKSAGRPPMVMANDLVTKGMHILLRPYDAMYRTHQKMQAPVLNPRAANNYAKMYELETKQLLYELLTAEGSPDVTKIISRSNLGVMYGLVYGVKVGTGEERYIVDARRTQRSFGKVTKPGAYLVDTFPFLNRLPRFFTPWRWEADRLYEAEKDHHLRNLELGLKAEGWTFAKQFSESAEAKQMSKIELAYSLGILTNAGFDTTTMALEWLVVACLNYPQCMAKAQIELDVAVGQHRLPVLEDKPNLPYTQAMIEETLRWRSIMCGGFPHMQTEDDEYQGYRIPKGAILNPVYYAIDHDPADYDDPDTFNPDRWIGPDALAYPVGAFGFGRRICTGRHIARNNMFVIVSRLLWAFNIEHARDEHGNPIDVDPDAMDPGFNTKPLPYKARMHVRGPWAEELIRREYREADTDIARTLSDIGRTR